MMYVCVYTDNCTRRKGRLRDILHLVV